MQYRVNAGTLRQELELDLSGMVEITKDGGTIQPRMALISWERNVHEAAIAIKVLVFGPLSTDSEHQRRSFKYNREDPDFPEQLKKFVDSVSPEFAGSLVIPVRLWSDA